MDRYGVLVVEARCSCSMMIARREAGERSRRRIVCASSDFANLIRGVKCSSRSDLLRFCEQVGLTLWWRGDGIDGVLPRCMRTSASSCCNRPDEVLKVHGEDGCHET
jgi:hypothetical protein